MKNIKECTNKSVTKWISVLYRRYQMEINKELKSYDLNSSQYMYLVQLYKGDHVTQDRLAKDLHMDKSTTARAVKHLQNKGYIVKVENPDDGRSQYICLTDKAHGIKKEIFLILDTWNEKMTMDLSDEEYDDLYGKLRSMAEKFI